MEHFQGGEIERLLGNERSGGGRRRTGDQKARHGGKTGRPVSEEIVKGLPERGDEIKTGVGSALWSKDWEATGEKRPGGERAGEAVGSGWAGEERRRCWVHTPAKK